MPLVWIVWKLISVIGCLPAGGHPTLAEIVYRVDPLAPNRGVLWRIQVMDEVKQSNDQEDR